MHDTALTLAIVGLLGSAVGKLWVDVKATQAAHLLCEINQAKIIGQLEQLERELQTLRADDPAIERSAWVVANTQGRIVDAGGRVAAILRYRSLSLIGESIEILIPPELLDAHHLGFLRVADGEPLRTMAITGQALRADRSRVNVVVVLSDETRDEQRVIRADLFEVYEAVERNRS